MAEKTRESGANLGNFETQDHVVTEPVKPPPAEKIVVTPPPPVAKKPTPKRTAAKKPVTKAVTMQVISKLVLVDGEGKVTELDLANGIFRSQSMDVEIEGGVVVKGTGTVWTVNLDSLQLWGSHEGLGGQIEFDPRPDPDVRPIVFVRTTEAKQ